MNKNKFLMIASVLFINFLYPALNQNTAGVFKKNDLFSLSNPKEVPGFSLCSNNRDTLSQESIKVSQGSMPYETIFHSKAVIFNNNKSVKGRGLSLYSNNGDTSSQESTKVSQGSMPCEIIFDPKVVMPNNNRSVFFDVTEKFLIEGYKELEERFKTFFEELPQDDRGFKFGKRLFEINCKLIEEFKEFKNTVEEKKCNSFVEKILKIKEEFGGVCEIYNLFKEFENAFNNYKKQKLLKIDKDPELLKIDEDRRFLKALEEIIKKISEKKEEILVKYHPYQMFNASLFKLAIQKINNYLSEIENAKINEIKNLFDGFFQKDCDCSGPLSLFSPTESFFNEKKEEFKSKLLSLVALYKEQFNVQKNVYFEVKIKYFLEMYGFDYFGYNEPFLSFKEEFIKRTKALKIGDP